MLNYDIISVKIKLDPRPRTLKVYPYIPYLLYIGIYLPYIYGRKYPKVAPARKSPKSSESKAKFQVALIIFSI